MAGESKVLVPITVEGPLKPFLRWAGSKRKLLKYLEPFLPVRMGKYYEPFLGGGALFFHLQPRRAEVSDASESLIETYRAVQRAPFEILKRLRPLKPTKKNFDQIKKRKPVRRIERAAQFIFLNKACWNGLYRVNSSGEFNVPYGWPKSDFIVDDDNLVACSKQLRRRAVTIRCQDFEDISDRVAATDFVFLDPPYVTSHNLNGFADWNEQLFSWKDQKRLAAMARRLVARGANVLVTNADHEDIHRLYSGFGMCTFDRASTLAGDTTKRRRTSEAILFAGPHYKKLKEQPAGGIQWHRALSS